MTEDTIQLPPILCLPWPKEGSLHLYAHQKYLEFLTEVLETAPGTYLVGEEDLRLFLSDSENARLEACEDEIKGWLQKCSKDNGEAALRVYPYHSPVDAMSDMKKLITKVAERTVLKERRIAALNEINPPFDDGKKYLSNKEYVQFRQSLRGAADAYLDGGKGCLFSDWRLDRRADDYTVWTSIIKERKEKGNPPQAGRHSV